MGVSCSHHVISAISDYAQTHFNSWAPSQVGARTARTVDILHIVKLDKTVNKLKCRDHKWFCPISLCMQCLACPRKNNHGRKKGQIFIQYSI